MLLPAIVFAQDAVELREILPEPGRAYSVNEESVTFRFDRAVDVDEATLVLPDCEVPVEDSFFTYGFYPMYYCRIAEQIKQLAADGKLKAGDEFTVRLKGVRDANDENVILGEDGTASATYTLAALPSKLVSVSPENGSMLKSYYAPGDEAGRVVITFDSPLASCSQARYSFGNPEEGTMQRLSVPFSVENERVIVDFSGIRLDAASLDGYTDITLSVGPMTGGNGELVESNVQGSPGYVVLNYSIVQEEVSAVYGGFDSGDIDGESIEGWVSDAITFEKVRFAYTWQGVPFVVEFPASHVQVSAAPEDGYPNAVALTVPVSDLNIDAGTVSVSLVGAEDGRGNAVAVEGSYQSKGRKAAQGVCLGVSPAEGDLLESPEQFVLVFNDLVTVESAVLTVGGASMDMTGQCTVENNTVTLASLRGRQLQGEFSLTLKVKDCEDRYITYGTTADEVNVLYRVAQPMFECTAITPEESQVESLGSFKLTFFNEADANDFVGGFDPSKTAALLDGTGAEVATGTFDFSDGDDWECCVLTLDKTVTTAGEYTLVVPEGAVYNSAYSDMDEDFGASYGAIYNPELRFTFRIGTTGIAPGTVADGEILVYNLQGVLVARGRTSAVMGQLQPGIYVVNGKKIYVK